MAKILVIDDEHDILVLIKNILLKDNHDVIIKDSAIGISLNEYTNFDIILLDVMMPKIDGFAVCKKIRDTVDCPILFLTAKSMENDVMFGLGIGADDYITKPFSNGELRARISAHLRRENREKRTFFSISGVSFNLNAKEIYVNSKKINLTKSEYIICEFLARNKRQVFSKDKIYDIVYGYDGKSDICAITEHIKNIRGKLNNFGVSPIETVWGIGYKWI